MAAVPWDQVAPFVQQAYDTTGRVERADVLTLAEATDASDDVIDALDAIGSRVFATPDDARQFLLSEGFVQA